MGQKQCEGGWLMLEKRREGDKREEGRKFGLIWGYIFGIESIINFIRWCQLSRYPKQRDVIMSKT